ncbi:hypothetical protein ACFDR9_000385 [Janthinobacterium sp. CG_23.3]
MYYLIEEKGQGKISVGTGKTGALRHLNRADRVPRAV